MRIYFILKHKILCLLKRRCSYENEDDYTDWINSDEGDELAKAYKDLGY